ncbi:MAG: thrombospondin type 3 repeat-containing protein [Pyrinomonadaceae bacterium]
MYSAHRAHAISTSIVISQVYGGGGNANAPLQSDFIELFNRGTSPVSVTGWSVQYASAAGSSWAKTDLSGTIQPGQYYLVREATGAGCTGLPCGVPLPTADAAGTIAMSATAGKVALVTNTTLLTCGTAAGNCFPNANIQDFVGFGTTANNFEGTGPTPAPSNTNAVLRDDSGCTETDSNNSDFASLVAPLSPGAPNPRNTSSSFNVCGTPTPTPSPTPSPTPTLSVSNVTQGETNVGTTTFTFNVTLNYPALAGGVNFTVDTADGTTNPANAGSDYVAIVGGSGSIAENGTATTVNVTVNGDTTPEPNETFFVNLSGITGTTNATASGTGTITNDDVTLTAIYTIQGSGMSSPLAGTSVSTTGIVTGKRSFGGSNNGFYIQDPTGDGNLNTSEAILVFTGGTVPTVNVGDSVQVTGTVTEFESSTTDEPDGIAPPDPKTATELVGPLTTVVLSTGNPLPTPLDVTTNNILDPAATSRGAELEKYEFMRLSVNSLTVSEPSNNFGEFWGVETSRPRPFREPGIEAGDPVPATDEPPYAPAPPPFPPTFDGNFERIMVDSGAALTTGSTRRAQVQVTTGTIVTNIAGALDYAFDNYRIVLDASATPGVAGGLAAAVPVPVRMAGEFTIGHANLENFGRSNGAAFAGRLNKASLAIRNVMQTPDILGVIEVFDLPSLQDLATKINTDVANPSLVNYQAYLDESASTFANSQDIGYLVNAARVTVVGAPVQYHRTDTFTYCGNTDLLHDRPSYVLTADVPQVGTAALLRVTVVLNHTKSLIATDSPRPYGSCGTGTEGARNREKRRLQAEDIADLIESLQTENLVVLGDLNAFDFNDGLGDVVGTFKGDPADPENVVEPSTDRWTYELTNLLTTVSPDQQYSLLFEGNAQALDHVLLNEKMLARKTAFGYARYNADFSESFAADANRPERLSDHDAAVAYFSSPDQDNDGVLDGADNCPAVANTDQADLDGDTIGDACDSDDDNDGQSDADEVTCGSDPLDSNSKSTDTDGDNSPDCVDADDDNDGVLDGADNCPLVANTDQSNNDSDGLGDVCDPDDDNDGVLDANDNCPFVANANQADNDNDGAGDPCDADDDNDGVLDVNDNCPLTSNASQADNDNDGAGDACDTDDDNDGVLDGADNCPRTFNPNQADFDLDGIGDVCDPQTGPPMNKNQCKNGGWRLFDVPRRFKDQSDCIQYVNTGK